MSKKTLQLSEETAKKLYATADPEFKKMLEDNFGKATLCPNITDRVKTLGDACRELGINEDTLFATATDDYEKAEIAIKTFAKALREGKPENECYYYPWFRGCASGFSYDVFAYGRTLTGVGARLRVDTSAKAKHLGQCMLSFYQIYLGR
jgi:hypothetical protein